VKYLETWIRNGGILIPQSSNLKRKAKASSSSPTKPEDGGGSDVAKKSKKKKKLWLGEVSLTSINLCFVF